MPAVLNSHIILLSKVEANSILPLKIMIKNNLFLMEFQLDFQYLVLAIIVQ
jgi:hypothetical protein